MISHDRLTFCLFTFLWLRLGFGPLWQCGDVGCLLSKCLTVFCLVLLWMVQFLDSIVSIDAAILFRAVFLVKLAEFRCITAKRSASVLIMEVNAPFLIVRFLLFARLSLEECQVKHCYTLLPLPNSIQSGLKFWYLFLFSFFGLKVRHGRQILLAVRLGDCWSTSYAIGCMIVFFSFHMRAVNVKFIYIKW